MKLKVLAASVALAVTQLHAQSPAVWETSEYFRSRALDPVNADYAYMRGYTGKGSNIGIVDSGIDMSNAEFAKRIIAAKDFTTSGTMNDSVGHGTHVAGIAAAAKNSSGVHGVAFDANLIVAKVTNSQLVLSSTILSGASWASKAGADVVNVSSNFGLSQALLGAKLIAPGVYSTNFTNKTGIAGGQNPAQWAAAVPGNVVLVVAAGNDGTAWSGGLAQMATAVDSAGNLVLGGRMIIAGNWNSQSNKGLGPNSNSAATLCQVMVANVCKDTYKTSDFYLLAPGTGIASTVSTNINKLGLLTMTGTSMAAPVISGGVAIIHQMWPQMTGSNIVKLLLVTANKNLPGYNVNIMGQGMMDLERATRPIGNLGIPTTGRLAGSIAATVQPILLTGGSASTGGLGSIMLVDDFQRDFYTPAKLLTARTKTQEFKPAQASMPYMTRNNYTQFNSYSDKFTASHNGYEVALYKDAESNMLQIDIPVWADTKFVTGMFTEQTTWLGNMTNSFTGGGNNTPSTTYFSGLNFSKDLNYGVNAFGSLMHGVTWTSANSANIKNIGTVLSYTWNIGAEYKMTKSSIGAMLYQPVTVYQANADVTAPVGLDNEFNVIQHSRVNLAADVKETRAGLFYKTKNFVAFIEHRQNYQGQYNVSNNAVGFNYSAKF
jgi:hypothetical protein